MEVVLLSGQTWLNGQQQRYNQQQARAAKIEEQRSLINKLEQVFQNEVRPIAILEALNQVRPQGIYFTSTATDIQNHITIEGVAKTVNELNQYTDTLKKSGRFTLLSDPKFITKRGITTFSVSLSYRHEEPPPASTPTPSESAPAEPASMEDTIAS